ncbi:MFS transporter [Sabulibacter ruber]|uniref:MFS transporter n=1 Tax=Sabulibacter ruber TaxID=2811901 RepID=UPI001A9751F9|nr:MFS transporter [Sabulibacter ruber]
MLLTQVGETTSNKWLQHVILLTGPLLSVMDVFIINVAIPSIKHGLAATDGEIQLVIASYLLGYASFQITGGRAGDYFGRKKVFFWGMFFFTFSSMLCGVALSPEQLIAARFLQGLSGAFMMPQPLSYLQLLFPEQKERTKAFGLVGITLGIASVGGQFLGGYLSEVQAVVDGWRLIFFINVPIGMVALWAIQAFLQETVKTRQGQFDYAGVVLVTLALSSMIYALIQGREEGWPAWSFWLLLLSAGMLFYFIIHQKQKLTQGKTPLVNLNLFQIKDFNIGLLMVSFYFMMHASYLLIGTVHLQLDLGFSPYQCGLFFVLAGVMFMLASVLSIKLVLHLGKWALQVGVVLLITSFALQAILFKPGIQLLHIYLVMGLYGLGGGLVMPSQMNMALKSIPPHFSGAATGIYNTLQQAAAAVGISLVGGLFYYVAQQNPSSKMLAFQYAMWAEIACLVLVGLMIILLPYKVKKVV